jgi:signal transduction histidine kinase
VAHPLLGRILFRVVFAVYLAGLLTWLGLGLLPSGMVHGSGPMTDATTGLQTGVQYAFSVLNLALGVLLVWRRPDELVPRLLGFALLGTAATFNMPSHRVFHVLGSPWPIAALHFTFHIVSGLAYVWAVVLFPDGTLPHRLRVRRETLRTIVVVTSTLVALVCWRSSFLAHPQFFVVFFGVAVAMAGVGAQLLRLADPSTSPKDKATARLLCAALLPALTTALIWLGARVVLLATGGDPGAAQVGGAVQELFPAVFAVVPIVLCAGVIRYRLWDIDRLLSRVLVYGLIALSLSAAYVVAVTTGGWLAGGGLWLTVLVLSLAAVVVEPLRVAGRRWANRVVFGQVLSPVEAVQRLTATLERLTPADELQRIADVTVAATRASSAELWVIDEGRLIRTARSPRAPCSAPELSESSENPEILLSGGDLAVEALRQLVGVPHGWSISHHGEVVGLLAVDVRADTPLTSTDCVVAEDVAAHAGLVVHNARLTVVLARQVTDLATQAGELQASRRRLVAAQDTERRRLERDLHDGAQQALVAAIIGARACLEHQPVSRPDAERLREVLAIAAESITQLCGDGRPPAVVELGLRGALERASALARRGRLDVDVEVAVGALAPEIEAAVYFCCVESLQNVVKHAGASRATVVVGPSGPDLAFTVVDDGGGFDPQALGHSSGLEKLAERLAVRGGTLTVSTGPEGGCAVRGRLPLGVDASGRR